MLIEKTIYIINYCYLLSMHLSIVFKALLSSHAEAFSTYYFGMFNEIIFARLR